MLIDAKVIPDYVIKELEEAKALPFKSAHSATTQVAVQGWPSKSARPGFYMFPIKVLRSLAETASP